MYYECNVCGKIVDDGCYTNKICACCILDSVDESRSEELKNKNAQKNNRREYLRKSKRE